MGSGILKGNANFLLTVFRLLDCLIVLASGSLAYFLSNAHAVFMARGIQGIPDHYLPVLALCVFLVLLVFPLFRIYRVWRGMSTLSEIRFVTLAWMTVALLMMALAFITKSGAEYSRSWMLIFFVLGWTGLVMSRIMLRLLLRWLRSNGFNHRHIVLIGAGDQAQVVADRLMKSTWFGIEISALYESSSFDLPAWLSHAQKLHNYDELRKYVIENCVDQVWIALPHSDEKTIRAVIQTLEDVPVEIRYVPDIFEYQLMHHQLTEMAGIPVVNISYSAIDGPGKLLKAVEDYMLSSLLLVLAMPAMLLIAAGVKLSSPGPVLYRQKRVGWNGKEFTMFKFRTMPVDAEKETGPVWASKGEQRATSFGAFLRKTSLDELPQLYNVLMGEMSLIGPRPERPVFVEKYKEEIPHYNKKHLVKAGMTGWAQVHGWRGNTCLHTRIEHDLYYIENWSLWLDIKIIIMTVFKGLIHKNAY